MLLVIAAGQKRLELLHAVLQHSRARLGTEMHFELPLKMRDRLTQLHPQPQQQRVCSHTHVRTAAHMLTTDRLKQKTDFWTNCSATVIKKKDNMCRRG